MDNQQQNKPDQGLKNIWVMATIFLVIVLIIGGVVYFLPNKKPLLKLLSNRNKPSVADDTGATPTGINSVVKANNQFALNLYSQLKNKPGNIFFSPYSISTALSMVYEGARGQTAKEMQSVFNFPKDDQIRRSSFASIYNQFNKPSSKYKLSVANALWAEKSYHFLKSYLETVKKYYGGKATNLDFVHSTELSRQTINHWVEDKTNNKIKNLLPAGSLNSMTRLVLTNAIYFKGDWLKQFKKSQTTNEDFHLSPTKTIKIPMMRRTDEEAKFNYAENDKWQALEMPYKGKKLSMIVLLPKRHNLSELESSLSLEEIDNLKNKFKKQRVGVFMPKFTFNTKYLMNDTLSQMGMPTAFSNQADFSGTDGTQNLFISKVIHQAFIKVDEEGTEAAAATGVVMDKAVMASNIFRVDHPFIFLIQDKENGEILFLGRIVNPNIG
ncbi:MAG TPA: serpin family protein, partial [Candidatus Portnoybacteria bacterium]|nr:serpin family protein [Candidatus Portnoybacteria bacterium]